MCFGKYDDYVRTIEHPSIGGSGPAFTSAAIKGRSNQNSATRLRQFSTYL
jgi:hypothetical protein